MLESNFARFLLLIGLQKINCHELFKNFGRSVAIFFWQSFSKECSFLSCQKNTLHQISPPPKCAPQTLKSSPEADPPRPVHSWGRGWGHHAPQVAPHGRLGTLLLVVVVLSLIVVVDRGRRIIILVVFLLPLFGPRRGGRRCTFGGCSQQVLEQVDKPGEGEGLGEGDGVKGTLLNRKFMSCSHCQELGQLALLIGCPLLCSQSAASFLVDRTLDNDFNS